MSFDAITGIVQAEDAAKVAVSYARVQAKQMIADAEAAGAETVKATLEKAEKDLQELRQKSERMAAENARKSDGRQETKKAVLAASSESRMDKAAAAVVERIVNG